MVAGWVEGKRTDSGCGAGLGVGEEREEPVIMPPFFGSGTGLTGW